MAIQLPVGEGSPFERDFDGKENITGFERASQEIEKASQEEKLQSKWQDGRPALAVLCNGPNACLGRASARYIVQYSLAEI